MASTDEDLQAIKGVVNGAVQDSEIRVMRTISDHATGMDERFEEVNEKISSSNREM